MGFGEEISEIQNKYGDFNGDNIESVIEFAQSHGMLLEWVNRNLIEEFAEQIKPLITYEIVGKRTEKYMEKGFFEGTEEERIKDIICCTKDGKKYEIHLWSRRNDFSPDPEQYGCMQINEVEEFGEITDVPRDAASFTLVLDDSGDFSCPAFSYSLMGSDMYSPWGYAEAEKDFFVTKNKVAEQTQERFKDDLNNKSVEELQEVLNKNIRDNDLKKLELERADEMKRKQELIRAIRVAQEESRRLDEALNQLREEEMNKV